MKKNYYQDEVDLTDFAKNVLPRKRGLLIFLSLLVFISAFIGFVVPIQHKCWATVKIGFIAEPLLRRVDVKNKLTEPQIILPVLRKFYRSLKDKQVKNIFTVEDMSAVDVIKLSVKYPNPRTSVDICNNIAGLFVSQGSISFKEKLNLLEEQIRILQAINRLNKDKMVTLSKMTTFSQEIPEQQTQKKTGNLPPESVIVNYKNAGLSLTDKISRFKNELMNLKDDYADDEQITYEKRASLLSEMIVSFEELQRYYDQRIASLSKNRTENFMDSVRDKELMKYENNYSLLLDDIFELRQRVVSAKDFEILTPAVFSKGEVLIGRLRQTAVSVGIGFAAGLLIIFLKEFFINEIKELFNKSFIRKRKCSYAGS